MSKSSLLAELRRGEFEVIDQRSGDIIVMKTYLTKTGTKIQIIFSLRGEYLKVDGIKMGRFFTWRIKRAMRKGALK